MRRRVVGLLWVGAVALLAGAVVLSIALVRSRSEGCSLAPPSPDLPDRLRAIGDFDRPYDASKEQDLEDLAQRGAAALHPDLIGTIPERSVRVAAAVGDLHDAMVVPLSTPSSSGPRQLAGAVAFLLDCGGRAYFSAVEDVSAHSPPVPGFPAVGRAAAAVRLGEDDLTLIYRDTPFRPLWHAGASRQETPAA